MSIYLYHVNNNLLNDDNRLSFFNMQKYDKNEPDKIILENNEHKLISYLKRMLDLNLFDPTINAYQSTSDRARHECALGTDNKSKDTNTVDELKSVLDQAENLNTTADRFKNNYNNNSHITNQKNKILNKTNYYNSQISVLKSNCDKIIIDNSANIKILKDVLNDAENNSLILNNNSNSLDNNLIINNDYSNYLTGRINIPKSVSTNNYEELYKAVILQNDILQNTFDKVTNNILLDDKKSGFVSENKSFIYSLYLKLVIIYYILVIGFIIFLIFINKEWIYYKKIIIAIISLIFPALIFYIETFLYNIWLYALSMMSSSVYTYTELA